MVDGGVIVLDVRFHHMGAGRKGTHCIPDGFFRPAVSLDVMALFRNDTVKTFTEDNRQRLQDQGIPRTPQFDDIGAGPDFPKGIKLILS